MDGARSFLRGANIAHKMLADDGQKVEALSPDFYEMHGGPPGLDVARNGLGELENL